MIRAILESTKADSIAALAPEKAGGNSPMTTTATPPSAANFGSTVPQSKGPSTSDAKHPESTTTSCREAHLRRIKSSKNRPSGSVDEELRPSCLIRMARQAASLRQYRRTEDDSPDESEVIQCYCHTYHEERQARVRDARPLCLATCYRWASRTKESYEGSPRQAIYESDIACFLTMMTAKGRCSSNGNPAISEAARRVLYHAMNAHSYDMTRADFSGLRRQQAEHKIAFDLHGDSRFSFNIPTRPGLIGQFYFTSIDWDCTGFTLVRQVMHYAEPELEWHNDL
jgi:hypothetical protein